MVRNLFKGKKVFSFSHMVNRIYQYNFIAPLIEHLCNLQKQGVKVLMIDFPVVTNVENPSEYETLIIQRKFINGIFSEKSKDLFEASGLSEKYSFELIVSGQLIAPQNMRYKDYIVSCNKQSEYVNFFNHNRYATNIPLNYYRTVHLFGGSTIRGSYIADADTFGSALQRLVIANRQSLHCLLNFNLLLSHELFCEKFPIFSALKGIYF